MLGAEVFSDTESAETVEGMVRAVTGMELPYPAEPKIEQPPRDFPSSRNTHRYLGISPKIPSFLLFFPSDGPIFLGFSPAPLHPLANHNLPIRDSTPMARSPELARLFQQPDSPTQRRYEICRAYFLEDATAQQLAHQYQLHVGTVRAIIRDFASQPDLTNFFLTEHPGRKSAPKRAAIQERFGELRRQGGTLANILATLRSEGFDVSESSLFRVLQRAGLTTPSQIPTPAHR